ncbi:MAG: hypothetical protein DI548_02890 [Flavobacterium johnsoniae]|nr:MAG: hypothetical protein DI548_02890 [Flavobacterium johnsoniae]
MQKVNVNWTQWGEFCLAICSFVQGALLMIMATTNNLFVMYAGYIFYRIIYQGIITIAQYVFPFNRYSEISYSILHYDCLLTHMVLFLASILSLL